MSKRKNNLDILRTTLLHKRVVFILQYTCHSEHSEESIKLLRNVVPQDDNFLFSCQASATTQPPQTLSHIR